MQSTGETILVWDSDSEPPTDCSVIMWNSYSESGNVRSVLKALEQNSDTLREEYLKWIHDLGELRIQKKRIVEHLEVEPGFSLWWMSLLAEKNFLKSSNIFNCMRLLAMRILLIKYNPSSVQLVSRDSILAETVKSLCVSLNIDYSWNTKGVKSKSWSIHHIRQKIPHVIKAPIFLLYYIFKCWSLRRIKTNKLFYCENSIFFFSYFTHLDKEACASGKFYSYQWEVLPGFLHKCGKRTNWIHHFLFSESVPNTATGIRFLNSFNQDAENQGMHTFLDSFLVLGFVFKVLYQWFKYVNLMILIDQKLEDCVRKHSVGYLWPFLRQDLKSSVYGTVAVENLIFMALFDKALASIPKQSLGLYLCENQGWERAFIHFWKKHGHGELIAVPHSTIRYWDLRYFDDPQVWQSNDVLTQPLPDKIALNGPAAWEAYQNAKQPMDLMVKVEALRYLDLNKIKVKKNITLGLAHINRNLLILGDYVTEMTKRGLHLLNELDISIISQYKIHFKSHPATPIKLKRYNNLVTQTTNNPLPKILSKMDVVVSTSSTSAIIEPFVLGIPVIVIIDDYNLNTSPLRGEQGVYFVRTTEELHQALINVNSKLIKDRPNDYFWIDPELPRWKALLGIEQE